MDVLQFENICKDGNGEEATKYFKNNFNVYNININHGFCILKAACENGYLNIVQSLLFMKPDIKIYTNDKCIFNQVCCNGHLHVAKYLLSIEPNNNMFVNSGFSGACINGHLQLAQYLLSIEPDIDVSADNNNVFNEACGNGHLHVAQWLLSIKPDIDVSDEMALVYSCNGGHLHIAKWVYSLNKNIQIDKHSYDEEFAGACYHGYLEMAQWLYSLIPGGITIFSVYSGADCDAFYGALYNGHIHVAQYLLSIATPEEINEIDYENHLIMACLLNNFNVVKWLLEIKPNINLSKDNNYAFKMSCEYNNVQIAQYIQSVSPFNYIININSNKINNYVVLPEKKTKLVSIIWLLKQVGYENMVNATLLDKIQETL